jgi:predicted dehydrogenase
MLTLKEDGKLFVRKNNFKVIIVGCGRIAGGADGAGLETHACSIRENPNVSLQACVSNNLQKGKDFGEKYACDVFIDLSDALDNIKPDVVSICTPDSTHFSLTKEVLSSDNAPKVIFLEKPACRTQEEYEELKQLANHTNVLLVVNQTRRFSPKYNFIKKFISERKFGRINRVNATYYSGWFHNGIHLVDTLTHLFEDEIIWDNVLGKVNSPYEGDPSLELSGSMKKSKVRVNFSAIDEHYYQLFDIDLWFELGRLRIEDFGQRIIFEEQIINNIGEKVLKPLEVEIPQTQSTEMQIAYNQICDFLKSGSNQYLLPVTISEIETTMKTLWQGQELSDNYYECKN